eukprot:Selendium_serpulae@DN5994_c0_g2_i4.p1
MVFSKLWCRQLQLAVRGRRYAHTDRIAVVGAGQMGTGIAVTAARAQAGAVKIIDVNESQLSKSRTFIDKFLNGEIKKGRETLETVEKIKSNITFQVLNQCDALESDFVIEAVTENVEVKQQVFQQLDKITPPDAILATNTSSIAISKIASSTARPGKVIGMHFVNPVPKMPLVEIIAGLGTTADTIDATKKLCGKMGKEVGLSLDRPGFVSNRILMPYINEASLLLQEGTANKEDIDKIIKLGTNVPMGPLTLADFIGLDTCFIQILEIPNTDRHTC